VRSEASECRGPFHSFGDQAIVAEMSKVSVAHVESSAVAALRARRRRLLITRVKPKPAARASVLCAGHTLLRQLLLALPC
jgi:hypothetical protein